MAEPKYYITCSIAYLASSITDLPIMRDPWLHVRHLSVTKVDEDGKSKTAWYSVVYIWDTREIVQWVEHKGLRPAGQRDVKAIDNAERLKDPRHLVPAWAMQKLSKKSELWSEANLPH